MLVLKAGDLGLQLRRLRMAGRVQFLQIASDELVNLAAGVESSCVCLTLSPIQYRSEVGASKTHVTQLTEGQDTGFWPPLQPRKYAFSHPSQGLERQRVAPSFLMWCPW